MIEAPARTPPVITPRELAGKAQRAKRLFIFSDYDGTLVPIAPTPEEARPDRDLLGLLERLVARPGTRLALVSGRDLAQLLEMFPVPGLYLAGCHGVELVYPGGRSEALVPEISPVLAGVAARVRPLLAGRNGFILEEKKYSLALHYRLADPSRVPEVLKSFREAGWEAAERHGLVFAPGKKVLELRPRNAGKGTAVLRLLRDFPGALPVYLGDDTTDEDAFKTLASLGGITVLVSSRPVPSAAACRLPDPASARQFLSLLVPGAAL